MAPVTSCVVSLPMMVMTLFALFHACCAKVEARSALVGRVSVRSGSGRSHTATATTTTATAMHRRPHQLASGRYARSFTTPATYRRQQRDGHVQCLHEHLRHNPAPTKLEASRRKTAVGLGGAVASIGLFNALPAFAVKPLNLLESYKSMKPKNVVITGANSGIGLSAAKIFAEAGHNVFLVCRTLQKAQNAASEIRDSLGPNLRGNLKPMECDLADLSSVRRFVDDFKSLHVPLNVLVANAGLSLDVKGKGNVPRTKDGFELTIGTNYLGHFLLVNLLLDELENSGKDSRIVITGSEVHDPSSPGGSVGPGATLGDLSGLKVGGDMMDGGKYDPDKAYKDSKLADVMFALELQRRLTAGGKSTKVNSFGPGLITRSGFFRNQNQLFSSLFDFAATDLFHVTETVDFGGACIAYLALSPDLDNVGGKWYNAVEPGKPKLEELNPSMEAMDAQKAVKLFDTSAKLVGLAA